MNCADCKREISKDEDYFTLISGLQKVKPGVPLQKPGPEIMILCQFCGAELKKITAKQFMQ